MSLSIIGPIEHVKRGANMVPKRTFGAKATAKPFSLASLPWDDLWEDSKDNVNLQYFIGPKVLPALMAFLSANITLSRTEGGLVSITNTLAGLRAKVDAGGVRFDCGTVVTPAQMNNIFRMLRHKNRSEILGVGGQTAPQNIRFAANVPLFMSAFKEYRGIQYKDWDLTDEKLSIVVDPQMIELLELVGSDFEWSNDELVQLSIEARTHKGGKTPGKVLSVGVFQFRSVADEEFHSLPLFVKQALCRHWVFNPQHPNPLGISNMEDIDAPSTSLIELDLIPKPKKISKVEELTW